jgi:hypothetical protein
VSVHLYRASVQAALADPPPVSTSAAAALADAVALEDLVDGISALDTSVGEGRLSMAPDEVDALADQILAVANGAGSCRPDDVIAHLAQITRVDAPS